jgi:hypothetical protein
MNDEELTEVKNLKIIAQNYIRNGGRITKCVAHKHSPKIVTLAEKAKLEREEKKQQRKEQRVYRKKPKPDVA